MEARANDRLTRLQTAFPQSDGSVLTALADRKDVTARYLAQVHDLTYAEAVEGMEWIADRPPNASSPRFASERQTGKNAY